MVEFGEQLRRAREEKGITQQTLAEQLFVTRSAVSKWERGERYPDLPTTKKIAEVLDVSLDDLLSGKDMAKVVEINPVIEKKSANNIMIALYAFILFANLLVLVYSYFNLSTSPVPFQIANNIVDMARIVLIVAIISYGLIRALRETLSPKRMGVVIVAYFVIFLVHDIWYLFPMWMRGGWVNYSLNTFMNRECIMILLVLGAVSVFIYFFRKSDKKVFPVLVAVVSAIMAVRGVYRVIESIQHLIMERESGMLTNPLTMTSIMDLASRAIFFALIIYQVITLYNKRKAVTEAGDAVSKYSKKIIL